MNLSIFILILNMQCNNLLYHLDNDIYIFKMAFPLLKENQSNLIDKKFLNTVSISKGKGDRICDFEDDYFFDYKTSSTFKLYKYAFLKLSCNMVKFINNAGKIFKENEYFFRFQFVLIDDQIKNKKSWKKFKGKRYCFVIYKSLEKPTDRNIITNLKSYGNKERILGIKEMFLDFTYLELHDFNEFIAALDENEIMNVDDSYLNYFKNCSECFENLKVFVNVLYKQNHLKPLKNELNIIRFFMKSKKIKIPISAETFKFFLRKTFKMHNYQHKLFKNIYSEGFDEAFIKRLINKCFINIENYLLENEEVVLPLSNRYYSFFYMVNYCKILYETLEKKQLAKYFDYCDTGKYFILSKVLKCIDDKLINFENQINKSLLDDKNVSDYFTETFGENVLNDYSIIEKIVCDYLNMFKYIMNLSQNIGNPTRKSSEVIRIINNDENDYKIIRGIRISFCKNAVFLEIKAFCDGEKEITLHKDIDYFINECGNLSITLEALKEKNDVKKIELTLLVTEFNKKFKVLSLFEVNEDGLIQK